MEAISKIQLVRRIFAKKLTLRWRNLKMYGRRFFKGFEGFFEACFGSEILWLKQ